MMNQRTLAALQITLLVLLSLALILFITYQSYSEPWDAYRGLISLLSQMGIGLGALLGLTLLIVWGSKNEAQHKLIRFGRKLAVSPYFLLLGIGIMALIASLFAFQLLTTTQTEVYVDRTMDLYSVTDNLELKRLGELPKAKSKKYRLAVGMNHLLGLSKPAGDTLFEEKRVYVDFWGKEGPIQITAINPISLETDSDTVPAKTYSQRPTLSISSPKPESGIVIDQKTGDNGVNVVVKDGDANINLPAADLSPTPTIDSIFQDTFPKNL